MPSLKAILKKTLRGAFSSTPEAPIHPQPLSQNPQALADLSDQDDRPPTLTGVLPESLVHPQPLSQNPIPSQPLANLSNQEDRLPITALSTGVYTIENVKNRNWAVLVNDDDRSDVISGNSAHKDAGEKVSSAIFTNDSYI